MFELFLCMALFLGEQLHYHDLYIHAVQSFVDFPSLGMQRMEAFLLLYACLLKYALSMPVHTHYIL